MFEESPAIIGSHSSKRSCDCIIERGQFAGSERAQAFLDLRPHTLNRVVVGRIRRKKQKAAAGRRNQSAGCRCFMRRQIVRNHDVAGREFRKQASLRPDTKHFSVQCAVKHKRSHRARQADTGNHRLRFVVPMRKAADNTLSTESPSAKSRHRSRGTALIQKHQSVERKTLYRPMPRQALLFDVGALLLSRAACFFSKSCAWRQAASKLTPATPQGRIPAPDALEAL